MDLIKRIEYFNENHESEPLGLNESEVKEMEQIVEYWYLYCTKERLSNEGDHDLMEILHT